MYVCISCMHANSLQLGPTLCVFVTPGTVTITHQAPLSIGFLRQEYLSGLPCHSPGDFPDPGIKPASPVVLALQVNSLLLSHHRGPCIIQGNPFIMYMYIKSSLPTI